MPVRFYVENLDGENNRCHSLSAQIPASHLMGLDLGAVGNRFQGLRRLIPQREIISRHLPDGALPSNSLARANDMRVSRLPNLILGENHEQHPASRRC